MAKLRSPRSIAHLTPGQAAEYLLEECRMVLPGLQALFGFQLIAVFSERFAKVLNGSQQAIHLVALGLVAVAIALVMTPAALHRQADPYSISPRFIQISTWLLLAGLPSLAIALALDFYLVAQVILGGVIVPVLATTGIFVFFVVVWFVLPRTMR